MSPIRPDKRNIRTDLESLKPYLATRTTRGLSAPGQDFSIPSYLCLGYFTQLDNERLFTPGDGLVGSDGGAGSTYTLSVDLVDAWSGLEFDSSDLRVDQDAQFTWTDTHTFQSDIQADCDVDFIGAQSITCSDALTISPTANLNLSPTGDIVLNPTGNDVLPNASYDINLGSLSKKYLALYAAELWAETLVAQDTLATIGGRILVGPTTELIASIATSDTTIDVKHNNLASGDRVLMETNNTVEWMAVTSAPTTITGGYRYSVTRNLDATGKNEWNSGDAVFNTGTINDGFIDLYSLRGVRAHEYDDETGATGWLPLYRSFCLANSVAFFRCAGVDVSGFAGTEGSSTPYILTLHDSTGKTAMGYIGAADAAVAWGSEILSAPGFESGGTGGDFNGGSEIDDGTSDDFTTWVEDGVNDGDGDKIEATATAHGGSVAVKITATTGVATLRLYHNFAVTAGQEYEVSFWTQGTGTYAGRYGLYDVSNGANIIATTTTGVTAAAYTKVTRYFLAPAGCTSVNVLLHRSATNGTTVYYDDVSVKGITHVGADGVHIVSTRDGSTRNWTSIESGFNYNGTSYTFEVRGAHGGQAGPAIVGNVRTSSTFNEIVECWAIGNLNGVYGYGTDTYGIGLGKYATNNSHVTIDSTNGIRMRSGTTTPHVSIGVDGDIFIGEDISSPGTTNVAIFTTAQTYNSEGVSVGDFLVGDNSASKANMFWDKSEGKLQFRGGTAMQAEIDTDGSLLAGAGEVRLNSDGMAVNLGDVGSSALISFEDFTEQYDCYCWMWGYGSSGYYNFNVRVEAASNTYTNAALEIVARPNGGGTVYQQANLHLDTASAVALKAPQGQDILLYTNAAGGTTGKPQTRWYNTGNIEHKLQDSAGANGLVVWDSIDVAQFRISSDGDVGIAGGIYVGSASTSSDVGVIHFAERSSDPGEPAEGEAIIWMSNGSGKGDDGDILIASKAGGTTNYAILFDHSAGSAW